jgi:hypothetical protein
VAARRLWERSASLLGVDEPLAAHADRAGPDADTDVAGAD